MHAWPDGRTVSTTLSSVQCRIRPDPPASALCVPITQTAVFALHTRNSGTHHGDPKGPVPESRRLVYFRPQRRRHEESRDHHLRVGLDAAYVRKPNHSDRGNDTTSSRQCWASWRRSKRITRPFEYSGRHRHGWPVRLSAGISQSSRSHRHGFSHLPEAHHARRVQALCVGFDELLFEHAKILRVAAEGDVW